MRYGMNPHQHAEIVSNPGFVKVLAGKPSLINYLDALNAWQLVRKSSLINDVPSAASFKHVSPAGAALAGDLDVTMRETWRLPAQVDPLTSAYVRARDADPKSSFGDLIAVSHPVTTDLADFLASTITDAIIAPGYEASTVDQLAQKRGGRCLVLEIDPSAEPSSRQRRDIYGLIIEQDRNTQPIEASLLSGDHDHLDAATTRDALLAMVVLRYTQSNSIVIVRDGMSLGIAAGQQNRVDCLTRHQQQEFLQLFGSEAAQRLADHSWRDQWATHLSDLTMASDGFIPFRDNIDYAAEGGVTTVIEPGGSARSPEIAAAAQELGVKHITTGLRLFHH
jgi:phosphoribosylaminoimidazolecarboxamide formyltransferase / IMP cyclohydrolase